MADLTGKSEGEVVDAAYTVLPFVTAYRVEPEVVTPRYFLAGAIAALRVVAEIITPRYGTTPTEVIPDTTPPSISNFSPTPGNNLTRSQVISFDVTDDVGLRLIKIEAVFAPGSTIEVVHNGFVFNTMYSNASNTRTPITGGYHYTILRDGGWPGAVTFTPYAVDTSGNANV
jgi:hypothetical protein